MAFFGQLHSALEGLSFFLSRQWFKGSCVHNLTSLLATQAAAEFETAAQNWLGREFGTLCGPYVTNEIICLDLDGFGAASWNPSH